MRRSAIAVAALALLLAAVVAILSAGGTAQGQAKGKVFTVGLVQDVDSFNPLVGVTVAAYEAWNIQYAYLTDKSPKDFSPIPGLALSWKSSPDKKTWTYKLRPNMKWSDGQPLTSEDVAYTINRSRKEQWLNYTSIVQNLTAKAPDPTTLVVHTSVPDPKLPMLDMYVLPKHIYDKYDAKAVTKYNGQDGVGSGPYVLDKFVKGQFARFKPNPYYYAGKRPLADVVIRHFNNSDAMVAALERGEVDAIETVPGTAFARLQHTKGITTVQGYQGAFNEFALNYGDGLKKGNPALSDPRVRQAIMHAIDKKTIVARVENGFASPAEAISPSANPAWIPKIPPNEVYNFDLAKANKILDDAGYKDTNGDGIREMPGGGKPLKMRYAVRSEADSSAPTAEFITGWLRKIGIATTEKTYSEGQLTELIGKGDYDMFVWGWTPFVDPDQMLSYFTCSQVSHDPKDPTNYYNDANWCDHTYDKLYAQSKVELNKAKRMQIVHTMLTRFYRAATYDALYTYPDLQAYRTGRFTGWTRQPEGSGPVLFSNTSPTYAKLAPVVASAAGGGGGSSTGMIVAIVVAVLIVVGIGVWVVRRRRTAYERD
jgi:peptide/nickel transport system substrate-binding protein